MNRRSIETIMQALHAHKVLFREQADHAAEQHHDATASYWRDRVAEINEAMDDLPCDEGDVYHAYLQHHAEGGE